MHIRTERLCISRFTPGMAEQIHCLSLDEENRRFLPDEVFETVEAAQKTLESLITCYDREDGPLAHPVLLKDGVCIGHVQLVPMNDGTWEIGYHIGSGYTGCGYATEAVSAFLPEIMRRLQLRSVRGICLTENAASIRVLRKCGFSPAYAGLGEYQGEVREISVFSYTME